MLLDEGAAGAESLCQFPAVSAEGCNHTGGCHLYCVKSVSDDCSCARTVRSDSPDTWHEISASHEGGSSSDWLSALIQLVRVGCWRWL